MIEDSKSFKKEFIQFQKCLRMSNEEMSELLGVSVASINMWRSKKPIPLYIQRQVKQLMWMKENRIINPFIAV